MSFLGEIKRRKVFQVAAVYAVVAWLIIQIVDVISDPLSLPDWLDTVVIVLLAVGFPLAVILAWAFDLTPDGVKSASRVPEATTTVPGGRFAYVTQALILVAVGFLVVDQYLLDAPGSLVSNLSSQANLGNTPRVTRSSIGIGQLSRQIPNGLRTDIAISAGSEELVYSVFDGESYRLFLRELDQLDSRELAQRTATNGSSSAFFSPDNDWVVFNDESGLVRVPVQGGPAQRVLDGISADRGAAWSPDGFVVIPRAIDGAGVSLYRFILDTGTTEPLVISESDSLAYTWPHILPGGHAMLFTESVPIASRDGSIGLLEFSTGEIRTLIRGGYNARYAPSGHIVFMRDESLWAAPFDLARLELTGEQRPVIEGIETDGSRGSAAYAFANDGLLAYLPGSDTRATGLGLVLSWLDRDMNFERLEVPLLDYRHPRISPNGDMLSLTINEGDGSTDIWTFDLASSTPVRRTFSGAATRAIWSPDQSQLVYGERANICSTAVDGSGQPQLLFEGDAAEARALSYTPDGQTLVFDLIGQPELYALSDGEITTLADAGTFNSRAEISPDGNWIAYVSDETGTREVTVEPFPNLNGGKWIVSTYGGEEPKWRGDSRELYYRSGRAFISVPLNPELGSVPRLNPGAPSVIFSGNFFGLTRAPSYDVSDDGERFLFIEATTGSTFAEDDQEASLILVHNWFEELYRLAPVTE